MKPLFNKYESYTDEAGDIGRKIRQALLPVIEDIINEGYNTGSCSP